MPKTRQVGLRLSSADDSILRKIAEKERRSEQEVLRDSLRRYAEEFEDQLNFIKSIEQGRAELQSGLGEIVTDEDTLFDSIRNEIRDQGRISNS